MSDLWMGDNQNGFFNKTAADARDEFDFDLEPETVELDPNADLIGYSFMTEHGIVKVVGTSKTCGALYVDVEAVDKDWKSVKPAGLVRMGRSAEKPHTCPFKTEINDDYSLCTCDVEQERECAWDI